MIPKISIAIPSYNMAGFIEETIQSIINQDYSNFECIVMDGGSNDGTLDILRKYENRIVWVSEKDRGQSDAINKGFKQASGDIFAYINADDAYEEGCFQKVADYFGKNPTIKWVYGKCKIINEKGLEIRKLINSYKYFWQKRYSYNRLLILDFIAQPAVFWRKELTDEIGLFDVEKQFSMEYEYWLKAGSKYDPGFIDDYLARFRVHPGSKGSLSMATATKVALDDSKSFARVQGKWFLIPLQYLNYFSIVSTYSILNIMSHLRNMMRETNHERKSNMERRGKWNEY